MLDFVSPFCKNRFPEDGTPLPKALGVDAYQELYFIICIILSLNEDIC